MFAYDLSMCEDIAVKIQPLRVRMKNYLTLTGRTYETWIDMEHEWNEKMISLYKYTANNKNQIKLSCQEPRPHSVLWHWNVLVHGQKFPGMLNVFFLIWTNQPFLLSKSDGPVFACRNAGSDASSRFITSNSWNCWRFDICICRWPEATKAPSGHQIDVLFHRFFVTILSHFWRGYIGLPVE